MSHGGGAAGSASGDEAAGLAAGAVHQVPGALQAAEQTHPAGRDPRQGHAGKTRSGYYPKIFPLDLSVWTHCRPAAAAAAVASLIFDLLTHGSRVREQLHRSAFE